MQAANCIPFIYKEKEERMLNYKKPNYINEVVTQAKLYQICVEAGLTCDLEYICYTDKEEKSVLDLIVIENHQIIAIVEVKRYDHFGHTSWDVDQIKRYKQFDVPVFTLYSIYDIPYLVKRLVSIQQNYLKLISEDLSTFSKNEKSSENRWEEKINTAIDKFNKVFPNYEFTNEHSLEAIADAVKILGLDLVLKIINKFSNKKVEDFFFQFDASVKYELQKRKPLILNKHTRIDNALSFGASNFRL
jgi:hypothetical protein